MKTKIIFYSLALVVLFGCSGPKVKIQSTYNKENNEGLVVGSICILNTGYSDYNFRYCDDKPSVNDYPNDSDKFGIEAAMPHFVENKKPHFLFSIAKVGGKYKFYKVRAFDATDQTVKQLDIDMDIKFEVVPGKTTYIGQINVDVVKKEFTVEDQVDRDRAWFAKKAPQIQF